MFILASGHDLLIILSVNAVSYFPIIHGRNCGYAYVLHKLSAGWPVHQLELCNFSSVGIHEIKSMDCLCVTGWNVSSTFYSAQRAKNLALSQRDAFANEIRTGYC